MRGVGPRSTEYEAPLSYPVVLVQENVVPFWLQKAKSLLQIGCLTALAWAVRSSQPQICEYQEPPNLYAGAFLQKNGIKE